MPYYLIISEGNKTGVTSRAETTHLSEAHESTSVFSEVRVTPSSVFNAVSLFVPLRFGHLIGCPLNYGFKLSIWLAALWITATCYPFDSLLFELRLQAIPLIGCPLNYGFKLSLWLAALWITASSYPFDWLPFELRLQAIPLVSSNISHWQTNAWSFIEYTSPWDGMEHLTNISNDRHRDPLPQCSTIYLGDRGLYFQFTWLICLTIV
jgi:hypothetical protein